MSLRHSKSFSRTVLVALCGLVGLVISPAAVGESTYKQAVYSWRPIKPVFSSALKVGDCKKASGEAVPSPVTIKVGQSYLLEPYTNWEKAKWGIDLVWYPTRAVAKRTFSIYDVSKISLSTWEDLEKAFKNKPVKTGIFVKMKYGYVGTPVKWDAALTTIVSGALASAEKKKEEDRKAVLSIVTGEIIRLAALKTAPQLGKPNMSDKLLEAVRSYYCSDSAKWKKYTPKTTLYMGFSETPKNLDLKPVDELITKKGALGQPLGVVIPSWPSEVSSE